MLRLVAAFNLYRKVHDISLAQICRETDISPSTMTRFAQGKDVYSTELSTILRWLLEEEMPKE